MKKRISFIILLITGFNLVSAQTKIITEGDEWQYYDEASPPAAEWINNNSISRKWKKGVSPLGYGDDRIKTVISFGENKYNKHITKYFKKTFRIEDPYQYLVYELKFQRDDGIVVYLNGQEFFRDNMPEGEITNDTKASGLILASEEEKIHSKLLLADDLIVGINTICVSIHQAQAISSDCLLNLELIGNNNPDMISSLLKERTIKNLNLDLRIKDLNHKLELEKQNLQYTTLEKSKNTIKTSLYIIVILLLISVLGLFFLWRYFTHHEKKLSKNITELKELNHNKDREMISNSIKLLNKQQYLKEIKKELETNVTEGSLPSIKKELKKIVNQIDYNLEHEEDWENLKRHFNALHTNFFEALIKLHPSLTEVELRHCIFIKLYMQTKEIATIMHIDPRSVQASRYRIKKKMNLGEDVDLRDYLLNL